jgi:hypothetical protein
MRESWEGSGSRSKSGSRTSRKGPGRGSGGVSPMGVSSARVGPGGSRAESGSKSGSWSESKSGFQSQSERLLERLDGSDAAWLSHWSRLMHWPCKDIREPILVRARKIFVLACTVQKHRNHLLSAPASCKFFALECAS